MHGDPIHLELQLASRVSCLHLCIQAQLSDAPGFATALILIFITCFIVAPALGLLLVRAFLAREEQNDDRACGNCGYDLTNNVSGACPECGRAIPTWQREQLSVRASVQTGNDEEPPANSR